MSPDYCIAWWKGKGYDPPDIDPVSFLQQRVEWRCAKGRPHLGRSTIILGDSTTVLPKIKESKAALTDRPYTLLFTSPPYYGVTNYHYDVFVKRKVWLFRASGGGYQMWWVGWPG